MRPVAKALRRMRTIASWPMRSSKFGRAVFAGEHPVGDGLHWLRSCVAEQARAFGGGRCLELLVALEQAGHAGQIQPPRRPS